ncbi:MAG: glycosyltransferase [Patescibacteria group bacterium]|nr:glycosyltransferase [Patescibacteria group bacterium]MBU2509138.1 glycosyltransferase [Patescibacteria group bacterium]
MPKFSIVIPTKNEEVHLPALLSTIKSQTYRDFEVIVADAFSTDKTREIARAFGAQVVDGGMPGPGRNRGAEVARGDIIIFLDADVRLPSSKYLEDCWHEMEYKKLALASCKVIPLSSKPIDRALHEAYNAYALATEKIRPHAPGFCILVRRRVHQSINGFDEEVVIAEDHDYVQRAARLGHKFGVLRSHPIAVSVRRLDKDGRLSIALKYVFVEMRMMTSGSVKGDMPFNYEMGGESQEHENTRTREQ